MSQMRLSILMLLGNRKGIWTVENLLPQSSLKVLCWGRGLHGVTLAKRAGDTEKN